MSVVFRIVFVALCFLISTGLPGWAASWVVSKVSQPAQYTVDGKSWQPLAKGLELPNGAWVNTGGRGRVMLSRNKEMILVKPDTMVAVMTRQGRGIQTEVIQQHGAVLLDVETRKTKHTRVHTPYLAAVVKGTRFEVVVEEDGANLTVERGLVETIDKNDGTGVDVRPGQQAWVKADPADSMEVTGPGPKAPMKKMSKATMNSLVKVTTRAETRKQTAAKKAELKKQEPVSLKTPKSVKHGDNAHASAIGSRSESSKDTDGSSSKDKSAEHADQGRSDKPSGHEDRPAGESEAHDTDVKDKSESKGKSENEGKPEAKSKPDSDNHGRSDNQETSGSPGKSAGKGKSDTRGSKPSRD